MPASEEIILAFPEPLVPATHARTTVIIGSIAVLRATGRFDDYVALLAPQHKDELLNAVAGVWMPMSVALAHYHALDALGLRPEQQFANGRAVFDKTSGTLLGTMLRMAKEGGITPWTVFPYFQRFWERGYDGGGVSIVKRGPKEATLDLIRVPLLESPYYRNSLRGLVTSVVELFCRKAYLTEKPGIRAKDAVTFRVQWA